MGGINGKVNPPGEGAWLSNARVAGFIKRMKISGSTNIQKITLGYIVQLADEKKDRFIIKKIASEYLLTSGVEDKRIRCLKINTALAIEHELKHGIEIIEIGH